MNEKQKQAYEEAKNRLKDQSNSEFLKENENIQSFLEDRRQITDTAVKKTPMIGEYLKIYMEQEKDPNTYVGRMVRNMKKAVAEQEILRRAAELCTDEEDKKALTEQRLALNDDPAIKNYKKYINGLKYIAGISEKLDPEAEAFYAEELGAGISKDQEFLKYRMANEMPAKDHAGQMRKIYQKQVAQTKAQRMYGREAMEIDRLLDKQFFGDLSNTERKSTQGVFRGRQTPSVICAGMLLRQGYPLEQILDPQQLKEEKLKAGKEYMEKRKENDIAWYANAVYKGGEAMMAAVKKYIQNNKAQLKTERDLTVHSPKLGIASMMCFDLCQEIENFEKSDKNFAVHVKKDDKEIKKTINQLNQFRFGAYPFTGVHVMYDITNTDSLGPLLVQQIGQQKFYKGIERIDPIYDDLLITVEEEGELRFQANMIPDVYELYGEDNRIHLDRMTPQKMKLLGDMVNGNYVNEHQFTVERTKIPVAVTEKEALEAGSQGTPRYQFADKVSTVLVQDDRQVLKTNVPLRLNRYLENLEQKNERLRGNREKNSDAYAHMAAMCEMFTASMKGKGAYNCGEADLLSKTKKAAVLYIQAKRKQKGIEVSDALDKTANEKMFGTDKEKGKLFTERGRQRYEFAVEIVRMITNIEKYQKAVDNYEKKNSNEFEREEDFERY